MAVAPEYYEQLEAEAKERQTATLMRGQVSPVVEKIPEREQARARDEAAQQFNVNPRYVSDAKKIRDEAQVRK